MEADEHLGGVDVVALEVNVLQVRQLMMEWGAVQ